MHIFLCGDLSWIRNAAGAAGSEMLWTTYRTSEKYQINSPFLWYSISLPSLNITCSLLHLSQRQLEILETVLSVVSYIAIRLFLWWKHSGWRNQGITFEKNRERGTVDFYHKISSPPTQICLW